MLVKIWFGIWGLVGVVLFPVGLTALALGPIGVAVLVAALVAALIACRGRGACGVLVGLGVFALWAASQQVACSDGACQASGNPWLPLMLGVLAIGVGIVAQAVWSRRVR